MAGNSMKTAALILALSAAPALACDSIVVHVASKHMADQITTDFNEINPGLGCRLGAYEIGGYVNSYDDLTAYAVRDWTHSSGFGVFAGVASGYQADAAVADHGITPVGGAVYRGEIMTVRAMPMVSKDRSASGAVVSFSFKIGG